ncbi:YjjG family noncanonical pyrimidine nucleotidase [Clostridium sp. D2Q-11]|uniref:YjjG family noncanonical pyrimidine nucleotidase n=1 Tax=Anaeromonas frigoriresistens TaxID=2683708 RepID=A0A942UWB1_9FIRM|nr:YjjG family noncanonical pyrimidine nucleotidase [Anaeromonas frigoriresistens]MBS4539265.1 YjjG family noncanonical pyrimidine nucleotidase [Anaeromonas frigoriresistens]
MKYEVIIFDADGTLFDFEKAERYALEMSMNHYRYEYDEKKHLSKYKKHNNAVWNDFEKERISAKDLKIERFRRFFEEMGMSIDPSPFSLKYMDFLKEGSFLLKGAAELVRDLHKDFRLVMLTNGLSAVQNVRIRNSSIAHYFEDIIISEEVGVAKPNTKIFSHTLEKIKYIDKDKIVIIGDSLKSDIKGGNDFGIDTIWYNPKKQENKTDIISRYEVETFKELKEMLYKR